MRKGRRLAGLALFLSIFWNGPGRAQETEEPLLQEEAKDPWAVLQTTPGILTDRINVSGSDGSCSCSAPAPVVEAGATVGEGFPGIDQLLFGGRAASRFLPVGFDSYLRRKPEETGEADLELPTQLEFLSRRGTEEWKARVFLGSSGGEETDRATEGFDFLRSALAEVGGPLAKDKAWIWGGVDVHEMGRLVLGGQKEEQGGWAGTLKLNFQLGLSAAAVVGVRRGDSDGSGLGAAPGRAPETTWEEDERETV